MNRTEAYTFGKAELADQPEGALDARLLLEKACGITLEQFLTDPGAVLTEEENALYRSYLQRRKNREPAAYILEEQPFMGYSFRVTKDTLIPNQDTEILVESAYQSLLQVCKAGYGADASAAYGRQFTILDLCTGTGCILLSILKLFSEESGYDGILRLSGVGTDVSEKALKVARENAARLDVRNASFLRGDLFKALPDSHPFGKLDMIVSNPPYVRPDELETLEPEVRCFEPELALLGGPDGLSFYRRIAAQAPDYLKQGGMLFFEIGAEQGNAVAELCAENGFRNVRILKDLAGKDRVVCARRSSPGQDAET